MKNQIKTLFNEPLKKFIIFATLVFKATLVQADPILVATYGNIGFNSNQFIRPFGVVSDSQLGRVYVSDRDGGKVLPFNNTGQSINLPNSITSLNSPCGMAIGPNSNYLWVAHRGLNQVLIYDQDHNPVTPISTGAGTRPIGIAINNQINPPRAYVLQEQTGTVNLYGASTLAPVPNNPIIGGLAQPQGIAVHQSSGSVLIADTGNNQIKIYNATGTTQEYNYNAIGTYVLNQPSAIAVVNSLQTPMWVTDAENGGRLLAKIPDSPAKQYNVPTPTGVSINPATGQVYVVGGVENSLGPIRIYFDQFAWVESGKSILQTLSLSGLNQSLVLDSAYPQLPNPINRQLRVSKYDDPSTNNDITAELVGFDSNNAGLLSIANGATLSLGNTAGISGNALEADKLELKTGGTLELSGSKFKIDSWTFNGGTLKVYSNATIPASVSPNPNVVKLSPQGGIIDVENGQTLTVQRSFISESNNDPYTLTKIGGGDLKLNISSTSIDKTVDVQAGSFTINNTSLTFQSGASLKVHPGARFVTLPSSVNGVSNLVISSGAVAENSGFIDNQGFWVLYGTLTNSGTFTNYDTGSIPTGTGNFKFKGGTFDTYSNATVNWNISLDNDNGTIITRGSKIFTITQPVTGNGNLTISGPGTTVLNGSNSYIGSTSLTSQATVKFNANSPFGSGNVSIQDGSTLQWGSAVTLPNNFTFFATIPTLDTSTYNGGISGKLSGGIGFIKKGSGSLTLSENNDYDDNTTIEEGTVVAAHNNALGTGSVTMKNGTVFQSGLNGLILANNFILDSGSLATFGSVTINTANNSTTLSGTISQNNGPMKLIAQGGSTLTLGGQASYSGGTDVQGGTTLTAGIANLFTSANHNLSLLDANSIFDMSAGNQTLGNINGVTSTSIQLGNKTLTFGTANDSSFSGVISGVDGKIVKQGSGTWYPLGENLYTGGSTIKEGTVVVTNNQALGRNVVTGTSPAVIMEDGTTLELGFVNLTNPITLNTGPNNQGVTFNLGSLPNAPAAISSVIDGDNKLLIKGSRSLNLTEPHLFKGGLELYDTSRISLIGNGNLANGSDVSLKSFGTIFDISLASPAVKLGALNGVQGSKVWVVNKTLTLTKNSNFMGDFLNSGNGFVIVDDNATLTLGGTIPRNLQINKEATAELTSSASIPLGTNIILAEKDATFNAEYYARPVIDLGSLNGVADTTFKWGNQELSFYSPSASTFDGVLEGGASSSIMINSNLTLGGQNLNTPSWFINNTILKMKAGSTLPSISSLTINGNNAVFDMSEQDQTVTTLQTSFPSPNSRVELGNKTLTIKMPDPNQPSAFSGRVNGNGGKVVKKGPAFFTFRGANTFSGGLFVEEGGVRISSPSGMGTGPITIYDQATLSIGTPLTLSGNNSINLQSGIATVQADFPTIIKTKIVGNGGFNKTGTAPLTLTQMNDYAGETFVNQGTLVVNGSIGNVTAGSGTVLTGVGSVGTVVNNGTVTPSDPVNVFTLKGDFLPSSAGITKIAINPNTSNKLQVDGIAHLNNSILSVDVVPGDTYAYENHEPFLVLESDNPVNGQFGAIESSHVRFAWTADYQKDPKKVFLDVDYVPFKDIVNPITDNPNIREVVQYLDTLPQPVADPDLRNILSMLNATPDAQGITNFFSEISPDELLLTEETASLINEINGFRMHYLRDMMTSPTASASFTTTRTQKATTLINQLKQAFGQIRADDPRIHSPAMAMNIGQQMQDSAIMTGPKGGVWIQGFGNTSRQKATRIDMGYRNKMAGSLIGVDYKLRPDLFVGLSFGYDQSRIKWTDALSKGKIKDYVTSLYSTWFHNQFYINASLTGSYNRYNIRRRMTFGTIDRTARSRHDGYVFAPSLEVGHGFTLFNGIDVVPFVRGDYIHIHEKSYTEKEAGALNLHIRSKTNTALRTEPGLNFYRHFKQEEGIITAKVKLSYVNKHPLKKGKITANLVGQPGTFLASGTNKTQHQVSPGLSLDYKSNSNFFVSAAVDSQIGSKYRAMEFSLKIGTKF